MEAVAPVPRATTVPRRPSASQLAHQALTITLEEQPSALIARKTNNVPSRDPAVAAGTNTRLLETLVALTVPQASIAQAIFQNPASQALSTMAAR